ncbi:hypothetical protein CAURIC_04870 [Corynebacterium auriscanis]|uniref:Uncharacterized protein n=2 Tax=Corynebacterium auriscanis TaxID=99807 RepID=A0A0A2DKJ1_9CORY|nr:hypothetical protein MA47_08015 [Corynebacterium auriscanis]WJY72612.1 hypothetical protein CAURIC_04870 [Corynebacterium auriscanis]
MDHMNASPQAPSPAAVAEQAGRRREEENKTPEQKASELARTVDELLAKNVDGSDEAAVLEEAHRVVNHALGSN